jgi:RAQPRD family integrative conjugative element protein
MAMEQTRRRIGTWPRATAVLPLVLTFMVSAVRPAIASDGALEREELSALIRQIELTDRLTEQTANAAPQEHARYHFDYARLRADLQRIRAGVQDYLVPQRAQPRDPVPLTGDYIGVVFAVLLVWGVWAIRTAYVGWSESRLNQRQFLGVCIRFVAMYLVLTFFLLS